MSRSTLSVLLGLALLCFVLPLESEAGHVQHAVLRGRAEWDPKTQSFWPGTDLLVESRFALLLKPIHEELTAYAASEAGIGLDKERKKNGKHSLEWRKDSLIQGVRWPDMPDSDAIAEGMDKTSIDNTASLVYDLKVSTPPLRGVYSRKHALDVLKHHSYVDSPAYNKISLAQRSHYFDLQYWHSMVPCELENLFTPDSRYVNYRCRTKTNEQVKQLIVEQSVEWFIKGCLAQHHRKTRPDLWNAGAAERRKIVLLQQPFKEAFYVWYKREKAKHIKNWKRTPFFSKLASGIEDAEFYLGNILHMIQDSYSGAHAARMRDPDTGRVQEGRILFFQDYAAQQAGQHALADEPNKCTRQMKGLLRCMPDKYFDPRHLWHSAQAHHACVTHWVSMWHQCVAQMYDIPVEKLFLTKAYGGRTPMKLTKAQMKRNMPPSSIERIKRGEFSPSGLSVPLGFYSVNRDVPDWVAIPGAAAAADAAGKILKIFKKHAVFGSKITDPFARCASGASALSNTLRNEILQLRYPRVAAGGTLPRYGGKMCPHPHKVMLELGSYTHWDHSLNAKALKLLDNRFTRWVSQTWKRVFHMRQRRHQLNGLELTCMAKCKRVGGRVARVGPACFTWNKRRQDYELQCCIDLKHESATKLKATAAKAAPTTDAVFLRDAMRGAGSHNREMIQLLTQRTHKQLQAIYGAYKKVFHRDLIDDVAHDTSGDYEELMKGLFYSQRSTPPDARVRSDAQLLFDAIHQWGTDWRTLNRILLKGTPERNRHLATAYAGLRKNKKRVTLIDDIKDDTSGWYEEALLAMFIDIGGNDVVIQDKGQKLFNMPDLPEKIQDAYRKLKKDVNALKKEESGATR